MKKMQIGSKLYEVTTLKEYSNCPALYPKNTAIETPDGNVLPLKTSSIDRGPGVYYKENSKCCIVEKPTKEEQYEYDSSKIIDYSNIENIRDVFKNNKLIRDIQHDLMTTRENIFCLPISQDDQPEMRAVKMAINAKQVDKKAYEDKFDQFQNDMRLLKGTSITLAKMIGICNGFDISCTLTLSDKEDCPNPMGNPITIDLTEGRRVKVETERADS